MTYHDALAYLDSLTNYERTHQPEAMRTVSLDRMRRLCEQLGNPQRRFRAMLVAGTNAKGSICAMIYTILRAANLRVGLYTSPHLEDLRERIRLAIHPPDEDSTDRDHADWISQRDFAACIQRIRPAVEALRQASKTSLEGPPTYFEVMTAAAFLHFANQGVDLGVLEVGLGGRLDATNVVEQVVSVLGPIGLDHTDVLGTDLVSVAREKAGILKSRQPVISATQEPGVARLLRELTAQHGAQLFEYGHAFETEAIHLEPRGMRLAIRSPRGRYDELFLPLYGRHQAENAAIAVAAVESLAASGLLYSAVQAGLARVQWPGRLELIQDHPVVLLDGAHNPPAALALKAALVERWSDRPIHVLLGVSGDKAVSQIAQILGPIAASVTCTASRHPRACDPHRLAELVGPSSRQVTVIPDVVDAYTYLLNTSGPQDVIVVTGSVFLVGELRIILQKTHAQCRRTKRPALTSRR